jgi:hypothetical protein
MRRDDQFAKGLRAAKPRSPIKIARSYIFGAMPKIKGYLNLIDALAIASVLIGQKEAALDGGAAEIGVFFGRSFFLMALLLDEHEKGLAIDLFDIGSSLSHESQQLVSFRNSGRRMKINIESEMLIVGDSHSVSAGDILTRTGPLRFFSIDGGHSFDDVMSDATLAANTISEDGVICFDDFCNPEWPEVTFGIYDFLRANATSFVPFLVSQKKLFVCNPKDINFYTQLIWSADALRKILKSRIVVMGHSVVMMRTNLLEYLRLEGFARIGLGRLNGLLY